MIDPLTTSKRPSAHGSGTRGRAVAGGDVSMKSAAIAGTARRVASRTRRRGGTRDHIVRELLSRCTPNRPPSFPTLRPGSRSRSATQDVLGRAPSLNRRTELPAHTWTHAGAASPASTSPPPGEIAAASDAAALRVVPPRVKPRGRCGTRGGHESSHLFLVAEPIAQHAREVHTRLGNRRHAPALVHPADACVVRRQDEVEVVPVTVE